MKRLRIKINARESILEQVWSIHWRQKRRRKEFFTPSSRTFGHNSPPGRRLSSRKKETEGRIREMTGERRRREGYREESRKKGKEMLVCMVAKPRDGRVSPLCRRFESAVLLIPRVGLMKFLSQSFAIGWRNNTTTRKKKILFRGISILIFGEEIDEELSVFILSFFSKSLALKYLL